MKELFQFTVVKYSLNKSLYTCTRKAIIIIIITFIYNGKNNQAKYTIYNILKIFTNYRINVNSIYKDECWNK